MEGILRRVQDKFPTADLPAEVSTQAGSREFRSDIFKQAPPGSIFSEIVMLGKLTLRAETAAVIAAYLGNTPINNSSMLIRAKVFPGSSRSKILKEEKGSFVVYVREEARQGKANSAVLHELSLFLKIPAKQFKIVKGATSMNKWIKILGL